MALRNIAKKEPRMVNPQHQRVFQAIPGFTHNHTELDFSCQLDPRLGSSALHGQGSSARAAYACMHCAVWDKACIGFGDNSCQHCEDWGESSGGKLHLFSHEVPDQEHRRYSCLSVRIRIPSQLIIKSISWCRPAQLFFFCAAACNVAVKILNPKLNRLNLRFSRAIHMDVYNSKINVTSGLSYNKFLSLCSIK